MQAIVRNIAKAGSIYHSLLICFPDFHFFIINMINKMTRIKQTTEIMANMVSIIVQISCRYFISILPCNKCIRLWNPLMLMFSFLLLITIFSSLILIPAGSISFCLIRLRSSVYAAKSS
jgi:hypothetical protein